MGIVFVGLTAGMMFSRVCVGVASVEAYEIMVLDHGAVGVLLLMAWIIDLRHNLTRKTVGKMTENSNK